MTRDQSVTIDLGVLGEPVPTADDARSSARLRQRAGAAAAALVCLLTLGASAAGTSPMDVPLWTADAGSPGLSVGRHNLYDATIDAGTLVARDLATGVQRWRLGLAGMSAATFDLGRDVTAVTTMPESSDGGRPDVSTTFVRESTGEVLGRIQGYPQGFSPDGQLVLVYFDRPHQAVGCERGDAFCMDIVAWHLDGARVAWRVELPPGHTTLTSLVDGRIDGVADLAPDGTVRLLDLATGEAVATAATPPELGDGFGLLLTSDALMAVVPTLDGFLVTAYARPSLVRTWAVTVPVAPENRVNGGSLSRCARDVCLDLYRSTRLLDARTGAVKAAFAANVMTTLADGAFLAMTGDPAGPEYPVDGLVLDPTGRIISKLLLSRQVWWEDSGGRVLLVQNGRERTYFTLVDGRGRPHDLGSAAGTDLFCVARGAFLACKDRFNTLRVWRLPA